MTRSESFLTAIVILFALAGCAASDAGNSDAGDASDAHAITCPQIKQYSEAQLNAIQKGINALAQDSPLRAAMQDYEDLRDDARVCQAEVTHRS
jgi:hypothetical protein